MAIGRKQAQCIPRMSNQHKSRPPLDIDTPPKLSFFLPSSASE